MFAIFSETTIFATGPTETEAWDAFDADWQDDIAYEDVRADCSCRPISAASYEAVNAHGFNPNTDSFTLEGSTVVVNGLR